MLIYNWFDGLFGVFGWLVWLLFVLLTCVFVFDVAFTFSCVLMCSFGAFPVVLGVCCYRFAGCYLSLGFVYFGLCFVVSGFILSDLLFIAD